MTCGSDAGGSDSGWIDGGSNVYLITSSDNVGIGTTAPGAKLDVVGSGLFSQNLTVTGSVSAGSLTVGGDTITDFTGTGLSAAGNTLVTTLGTSISNGELDNSTITFAGDLGSSTTALGATRTISGGTNGIDTSDNNAGTLTINFDSTEVGTTTFGSGSAFAWTFDSTAGTDTSIAFGSNSQIFTSGTASFSGRLGIGTTAPTVSLDVVGSGLFSQNLTVTGSVSAGSLTVGGDTITDFTGTGLSAAGNTLVTTLGTSISNGELDNSTITFAGDLGSSTTALGIRQELQGTKRSPQTTTTVPGLQRLEPPPLVQDLLFPP
ncbi:hypothetical protein IPH70_00565 [Candidatus Roizmanbacteria bacterium]|nr:MAG: hypothetical protein IPH70_00565 [Candidatus Roizmanbacteria bacterium]